MRKIVKILKEIHWRKNAIADEQACIELEFGSFHGPTSTGIKRFDRPG